MIKIISTLIGAAIYAGLVAADPTDQATGSAMLGFSAAHTLDEQAAERHFDADLNAAELREWMRTMASAPNQVGSAHDKANAEFMLQKFRDWGWDASIETYSVLYPTPRHLSLQLIAPKQFTAKLAEPAIKGDASSGNAAGALPPYNVYGADGDVSGELVYVNYGMPEDYKELDRRAISVNGKIVIARYRGGWRGLKPKLAHFVYNNGGHCVTAAQLATIVRKWIPEARVDFADGAGTPLIDHQDGMRLIREIDFVPRPLEEGVRAHINEARLSSRLPAI